MPEHVFFHYGRVDEVRLTGTAPASPSLTDSAIEAAMSLGLDARTAADRVALAQTHGTWYVQLIVDSVNQPDAVASRLMASRPGMTPSGAKKQIENTIIDFLGGETSWVDEADHADTLKLASKENLDYDSALRRVRANVRHTRLTGDEIQQIYRAGAAPVSEGTKTLNHAPLQRPWR